MTRFGPFLLLLGPALAACGSEDQGAPAPIVGPDAMQRLSALVLRSSAALPPDATNRFADDTRAATLGKKFFFDPRFSGPLLDDSNNGESGTVGHQGETGRVSCASCHVPGNGSFVDTRSIRGQLSLASGWTHRRTPALLDLAHTPFLGWDGRRATAFSVVFGVIESPLEFNSSRLFLAQQIALHYRGEYEAVFGPLPALGAYPALVAADAGCSEMPADPVKGRCLKPGSEDDEVNRITVNFGKAIAAYLRLLGCGRSRFDSWMQGDAQALTPQEQTGAALFVGKGKCVSCHTGPYLTDNKFYNVGTPGGVALFTGVDTSNDRGAIVGLGEIAQDAFGPAGPYSDGDDGRLAALPADLTVLEGAFRTPGLRCIDNRPSFMHNAEFRSLTDVIDLFNEGGGQRGYVGVPQIEPLGLSSEERAALQAFLLSLQGPGPSAELRAAPSLP